MRSRRAERTVNDSLTSDHGLIDHLGTPNEIGSVLKREKTLRIRRKNRVRRKEEEVQGGRGKEGAHVGEVPTSNHRSQYSLVPIIDRRLRSLRSNRSDFFLRESASAGDGLFVLEREEEGGGGGS